MSLELTFFVVCPLLINALHIRTQIKTIVLGII